MGGQWESSVLEPRVGMRKAEGGGSPPAAAGAQEAGTGVGTEGEAARLCCVQRRAGGLSTVIISQGSGSGLLFFCFMRC